MLYSSSEIQSLYIVLLNVIVIFDTQLGAILMNVVAPKVLISLLFWLMKFRGK
jgi:hypothetical protein